jgi:hypothetical protein
VLPSFKFVVNVAAIAEPAKANAATTPTKPAAMAVFDVNLFISKINMFLIAQY